MIYLKDKSIDRIIYNLDTIIFDIDGVLIKVTDSFRKAISLTVNYYFKRFLKFKGNVNLLKVNDTDLFKLTGGFNDDWDLTYAAVIFYLYKAYRYKTNNLEVLINKKPPLNEYTNRLKQLGGGVKAVDKFIKENNVEFNQSDIFSTIKQIFMEYYAGDKIKEIYNTNVKFLRHNGLYKNEKVLLKENLPKNFKYGIVTGRTYNEAKLALLKLNLGIPREYIVCQDDNIKKPNYKCLDILANRLIPKVGLYVGDTIDDLNLVNNFKNKNKNPKFLCCIVNNKNKEIFIKQGCEIIVDDVNELIKWLKKLMR